MRLKVVSDGTSEGTKLFDAETGEQFKLACSAIEWHIDIHGMSVLRLTVPKAELEAKADVQAVIEDPDD